MKKEDREAIDRAAYLKSILPADVALRGFGRPGESVSLVRDGQVLHFDGPTWKWVESLLATISKLGMILPD